MNEGLNKILIAGVGCLIAYSNWQFILSGEIFDLDPYSIPFKIIGNVFSTLGEIISYFLR
tara:strand:+ start:495 stop:674 length:180 start_codon:yes stop_codon:yes gene_type:complete